MSRSDRRDLVWLGALCALLLLVLLPYYAYTALLLLIQREWGMSSTEAGWVFGATQAGYVAAVLLLMPLTDKVRSSYILLGSAALSVVGNTLFPLLAHGAASGALLRAIGGAGVAGVYMPGIRMISERFAGGRRGGPVGIYVAAFVLGGAVSFGGVALLVPTLGWRGAYLALSLAGVGSVLLAAFLLRGDSSAARRAASASHPTLPWSAVLRNRPVLLMTAGYTAHVWELYGMRAWSAAFLGTILARMGSDLATATAQAGLLTSLMVVLGGVATGFAGNISDRFGRTATAGTVLSVSAACSLVVGWLIAAPFWVVMAVCLLYGLWVNPDSPIYSTAVTEAAPQARLGAAMTFQTVSGFTAGIVAPIAFGVVLDLVPGDPAWGVAFGGLGVVALVGVAAMVALRRSPDSMVLAGGKR